MKTTRVFLLIIAALILTCASAGSTTLSFAPSSSLIPVGNTVLIDIVVSGLESVDISTFDFNIQYDPAVLGFNSYSLGIGLGDISLTEAWDWSGGDLGGGIIHLSELSSLWDLSFQPDEFTLATLSFTGAGVGVSALYFTDVIIGDALGDPITPDSGTGQIEVFNAVPEPVTILLFGVGLLGISNVSRKKG